MVEAANPYDKAHELARAITRCDIYQQYLEAKRKVEKDPKNKEAIVNMRNKQMELNRAQILGEDLSQETVNQLTLEFAKLNQNEEIAAFFKAESSFIQMFNDVQEIIQKELEKDLAD